ncbi:hypothetical protein [Paucibacter sp. Y2R2-4]|uniref:hypothetical protein n=1 Tax=Paucibacter sp. Y2R2-4 TaxID=2893553 RepID=UPI0021E3BFBD|nr:hypothetical protein [Paucibacter sp. Y2R2-4]MCV2348708.1 hypothetical protein [Paucibacter sp. Y2R2-4]
MSARRIAAESQRVKRFLASKGKAGALSSEIAKACRVSAVAEIVARLAAAGEPVDSSFDAFVYADGYTTEQRFFLFPEAVCWDFVPHFHAMPGSPIALKLKGSEVQP